MNVLNKTELLENLKINALNTTNTTKKDYIEIVAKMVKNCKVDKYACTFSSKGNANLGHIVETIALNYFNIKKEDDLHEIKALFNNSPNVLTNSSVKVVYVVVCSKRMKGLYKVNAQDVYNIKLTNKYLETIKTEKVCSLLQLAKA